MEQFIFPQIHKIEATKYTMGKNHYFNSENGYTMTSFGYVLKGHCHIESTQDSFEVAEGETFAVSPGCKYASYWTSCQNIEFYSLHLKTSSDAAFCDFYAEAVGYIKNISTYRFNQSLVKAMMYIESNYRFECDINELSEITNVSSSHLYYLFRKELNTTPIHYRNKFRLEKCAEELQTTELSEIDIAEKYGFYSISYFRECFKSQFGKTPFQYRNAAKKMN